MYSIRTTTPKKVALLVMGLVISASVVQTNLVAKAETIADLLDLEQKEEGHAYVSVASMYMDKQEQVTMLDAAPTPEKATEHLNVSSTESTKKIEVATDIEQPEKKDVISEKVKELDTRADGKLSKSDLTFIVTESEKRNVDPVLVTEMFRQESHFDNEAVGPNIARKNNNGVTTHYVNALGIAQIMPDDTGPLLAKIASVEWNESSLKDVRYSTTLATAYLEYLYYGEEGKFEGYKDWHKVLTAYNRGQGGLRKYMRENGTPVSRYSREILTRTKEGHL